MSQERGSNQQCQMLPGNKMSWALGNDHWIWQHRSLRILVRMIVVELSEELAQPEWAQRTMGGEEVETVSVYNSLAVFVGRGMGSSWEWWWWGEMKSDLHGQVDSLIKNILMTQKWERKPQNPNAGRGTWGWGPDPVPRGRVRRRLEEKEPFYSGRKIRQRMWVQGSLIGFVVRMCGSPLLVAALFSVK